MAYVLIYRTQNYKRLKATIDKLTKKLEKQKEKTQGGVKENKKVKTVDAELRNASKDLTMVKMKSDFFIFIGFTFAFISALNSYFDGRAVAKLPFEPLSIIQ